MSSSAPWSATVDAWRRLWATGSTPTPNTTRTNNNEQQTPHPSNPTSTRCSKRSTQAQNQEPTHTQTNLHGRHQELEDLEEYGHLMTKKYDNTLRIMLHNINRLPINSKTDKSKKLVSTIANKQIDIALLTEIGLNWKQINNQDKWYERVRESFQHTRSEISHNTNELDRTSNVQFGGVIAMAVDDVAQRVIAQGSDELNLGRWSWLLLEGKQGHRLRVVSAYRPVASIGPGTVFSQHERHLHSIGNDNEPRAAFYSDLFNEITKWKALGDHIVVGIDANEDVRCGDTHDTFQSLGMKEILLEAHRGKSPPATCDKNTLRQPIDGIFATPGINVIAGGYSAFNAGCPSDHRYLWVDVSYKDAFGYSSPPLTNPPIRRLKTQDPKMVEIYNSRVLAAIREEKLDEDLANIDIIARTSGWNGHLEIEYNRINDRQYEIRRDIERNIRKIRAGAIPWSPQLQRHRSCVEIWSLLLKKRKGRKISNNKLRRLLTKTELQGAYSKTIPEIKEALATAFQEYKKARESAANWREEFLVSVAQSRADRKGTDKDTELKQLRSIEQQRTIARNIKRMQGRLQRNATIKIYTTNEEGRHVLTEKADIEDACIKENIARFTQSNDTPPQAGNLHHRRRIFSRY
jgi:hypothetical protein